MPNPAVALDTRPDLISLLQVLPHPRRRRGLRIPLWCLLLVSGLAILSPFQSLKDLERYSGRRKLRLI